MAAKKSEADESLITESAEKMSAKEKIAAEKSAADESYITESAEKTSVKRKITAENSEAEKSAATESAEKKSAKRKITAQNSAADESLITESAEKTSAKEKITAKKSSKKEPKTAKAKALEELIKFWSEIINDSDIDIRQRIKASELKAKAAGIFLDSTDETGADSTDSVVFFGEGDLLE